MWSDESPVLGHTKHKTSLGTLRTASAVTTSHLRTSPFQNSVPTLLNVWFLSSILDAALNFSVILFVLRVHRPGREGPHRQKCFPFIFYTSYNVLSHRSEGYLQIKTQDINTAVCTSKYVCYARITADDAHLLLQSSLYLLSPARF